MAFNLSKYNLEEEPAIDEFRTRFSILLYSSHTPLLLPPSKSSTHVPFTKPPLQVQSEGPPFQRAFIPRPAAKSATTDQLQASAWAAAPVTGVAELGADEALAVWLPAAALDSAATDLDPDAAAVIVPTGGEADPAGAEAEPAGAEAEPLGTEPEPVGAEPEPGL